MLTDKEIDDLWMAYIPTNTSGTEWRRANRQSHRTRAGHQAKGADQ